MNTHHFPNHSFITTKDSTLTIGNNYTYSEYKTTQTVILRAITQSISKFHFHLKNIETKKNFTVAFSFGAKHVGYGWMWRLGD